MKHYLGYSFPLSGKDRTPAWIPKRMLREIFLPPFREAVKAGSPTIMVNSSEINGVPVHSSYQILTELLKNELGFEGFVVTDWRDIKNLYEREKVAKSQKDAVRMAVLAGNDMSMVPDDLSFYNHLVELVKEGAVPMSRVDDAVRRILKVKFQLGLFENPYPNKKLKEKFGSEEFRQASLQAARESMTLLKNDGDLLPLSKSSKILVTGPTSNLLSVLNGGWTFTWQGDEEGLYPQEKLTILEAVQEKIGSENVVFKEGCTYDEEVDLQAAVDAAKNVDAVILALGEMPYCETPGNIDDLNLPEAQIKLAKALIASGTPVAMILVEGRPRLITDVAEKTDAILMAYLPGLEGGPAVADVLFGDFNPCGKLPISYPRDPNSLLCYDHKYSDSHAPNQYNPLFPFGHGLSYTSFELSNLQLDNSEVAPGQKLNISVNIKNTGKRAGKEIVHLYLSDLVRSVTPPVKQLKRFKNVMLEPGERRNVKFSLTSDDLAFIGRNNQKVIEPGEFKITVGELNATFTLRESVEGAILGSEQH